MKAIELRAEIAIVDDDAEVVVFVDGRYWDATVVLMHDTASDTETVVVTPASDDSRPPP